jgi:hypothetical protein
VVLDVFPFSETHAGRFLGITAFTQKIPNALAARVLLATGAVSAADYTLLYLSAGIRVLLGGLSICFRVRQRLARRG